MMAGYYYIAIRFLMIVEAALLASLVPLAVCFTMEERGTLGKL
jgi:hypothetical protein